MFDEFKEYYGGVKGFYGVLKDEKDYNEIREYLKNGIPIFNRLITCSGQNNIVHVGPNIITANYTGTGRGLIGLLREYDDRKLHAVATKYLFSKEASIKKAKEKLEKFPRIYKRLESKIESHASLISERMTTFDMIPVDLDYKGDNAKRVASQREVMKNIKDHLRDDKTILLFQMRRNYMLQGLKEKSKHHNYLPKFSNTVSKIALDLYNESLSLPEDERVPVPVTPVAIYSDNWWNPFARTVMRIGRPTYASVFADSKRPIQDFTNYLEMQVADMLVEMGIPRNKSK